MFTYDHGFYLEKFEESPEGSTLHKLYKKHLEHGKRGTMFRQTDNMLIYMRTHPKTAFFHIKEAVDYFKK